MFVQPVEELGLIFEELEKFEVVGLSFHQGSLGCRLLSLVDLLDETIDGFAVLEAMFSS